MKITFLSASLLTAFVILVFCSLLKRQNTIASTGNNEYTYTALNKAAPEMAATIIQHWTKEPDRKAAVRNIIMVNYALMAICGLYLALSFLYFRRKADRSIAKFIFGLGLLLIIVAAVINAIQDWKIYHFVFSGTAPEDMRTYSKLKWYMLYACIGIFILAMLPRKLISLQFLQKAIRYLSQLLKSIWLFFPGLLFILFPIFVFWSLGQGKDVIAAFINIKGGPNENPAFHFDHTRILFFIAIAFWAYVSWYSARIIAYIKKTQQERDMERVNNNNHIAAEAAYERNDSFFEISKSFLDEFPRAIGSSCFLVLELAVFQSSIIKAPIGGLAAWLFFFWGIITIRYINKWIDTTQSKKPGFRKTFWVLMILFPVTVGIISVTGMNIWVMWIMILFLHVIFIFYTNLRRVMMEGDALKAGKISTGKDRTLLEKLMDYFCVPRKESGYFRWFQRICIVGIALYIVNIFNLDFSRQLGPFPFIILAFAVLLAFGNFVAAFSVRYKVNFQFLLFILALALGMKETHNVRTVDLENTQNGYNKKTQLKDYLNAWLNERLDSTSTRYDMYFVMSNGGASRSGYWTAAVLGEVEDASLKDSLPGRFSDHIFCLSGTSGGGVGVATFFSLLKNKAEHTDTVYMQSAIKYLQKDYFTYTFARMLGPDFFNYIFHIPLMDDRAGALETSFEESAKIKPDGLYQVPFYDKFSNFPAMKDGKTFLPILFVNTTRMQDGNPGVVTNLNLDKNLFNNRIDVVTLLDSNKDISITTASILGARFPYLSPAGRIGDSYFVDGGYFDNSGAGPVQEIIRGILNLAKTDPALAAKVNRINFKVLHIINSPPSEGFVSAGITAVPPIKNDLMSPILTIVGAYDMQTTVNDSRLWNYLSDINSDGIHQADARQVSLYLTRKEWDVDSTYDHYKGEPGYAMNWFMSDTTLRRINKRLAANPQIKFLCDSVKW